MRCSDANNTKVAKNTKVTKNNFLNAGAGKQHLHLEKRFSVPSVSSVVNRT
jgi:hypothetical protein